MLGNPAATVITSVSLDHVEYLGDSIVKIAAEKAGILKPGVPAVIAPRTDEARGVIERQAARLGAPLAVAGEHWLVSQEHGRLVYQDEHGLLNLPRPRLFGRHQLDNAGTAIAALRSLGDAGIGAAALETGLLKVDWPARLQRLTAGRGLMMALLLIPWSMITVINAELWGYIYQGTYGVADAILNAVGLGHPNILGQSTPAIIGLMIADIWKTTPFVAILVLAGLVMLPGDIYEAAEVDGSSGWSTFWRITVPLLRPTLALAVMFRVLQAFGLFDLPYVLTNGGPGTSTNSLAILGYNVIFKNLSFGPG